MNLPRVASDSMQLYSCSLVLWSLWLKETRRNISWALCQFIFNSFWRILEEYEVIEDNNELLTTLYNDDRTSPSSNSISPEALFNQILAAYLWHSDYNACNLLLLFYCFTVWMCIATNIWERAYTWRWMMLSFFREVFSRDCRKRFAHRQSSILSNVTSRRWDWGNRSASVFWER